MIEKKCKICGEWLSSRKIAMHYWNIHKAKYAEYKENEETREVEDPIEEPKKTKVKEEPVEVVKENIQENPTEIPEANPWLETVKYFEGPVTNETKNEVKKVEKHNWMDEGQTLNEWC